MSDALAKLNNQLRDDPQYQAALRGEWNGPPGEQYFPVGPDGKVLPGFRTAAARYYVEIQQSGGMYDQAKVNEMYQGEGNAREIDPTTGEWSSPNKTNWYDPQYVGPAVVGGIATAGILSGLGAAPGAGGMTGLAPAGYTVPSAALGANGGALALGTVGATAGTTAAAVPGSAAAQALVPSQITGLTTPGVGTAATSPGVTATAAGPGGGLLSRAGDLLKGRTGDIIGAAGDSISSATQAAGNNRIEADELNMRGNNLYENQLMARSKDEQGQRDTALDNVYRNSWYGNRQASPYNTRGLTPINDQFKQTLAGLADQGATKLANTAQYDSNMIPGLKPYEPSKPGLLERVGTWAGPILSGAGTIGGVLRRK